jgi:hypothetical protein
MSPGALCDTQCYSLCANRTIFPHAPGWISSKTGCHSCTSTCGVLHYLHERLAVRNCSPLKSHQQVLTTDREVIPDGGRGVWCGAGDYWTAIRTAQPTVLLLNTNGKHQQFEQRVMGRVNCANAFRMASSNSSFAMKSCARASTALLAGVISWPVDNIRSSFFKSEAKKTHLQFANVAYCLFRFSELTMNLAGIHQSIQWLGHTWTWE